MRSDHGPGAVKRGTGVADLFAAASIHPAPPSCPAEPDALRIAGVDEAGRGPLAGPLVVAAVILDPSRPIAGVGDSKALSEARREALHARIIDAAHAWHVEVIAVDEIDRLNVFQATLLGMRRAIEALSPSLALIDGNQVPPSLRCASRAIVGGDASEASIGAASILAKVTRDRLLLALDADFPHFGFARHKGYPTPEHLAALERHGPCVHHRRSFAPVRRALERRS